MLDLPSGNALPSGPNALTAGLDLFWSMQPLLRFEQLLFLSLFSVKKVTSEWCQPGGKQGVGRAGGKVSEQHPAQKETRASQCIPSHLPPMLGGGISLASFPAVSASSSSPISQTPLPPLLAGVPLAISAPGQGRGWAWWQLSGKGSLLQLQSPSLQLSLLLFSHLYYVLPRWFCPSISISECWLLCLWSTDNWLGTVHPSINSSPIPHVATRSYVLNQPHGKIWSKSVTLYDLW